MSARRASGVAGRNVDCRARAASMPESICSKVMWLAAGGQVSP